MSVTYVVVYYNVDEPSNSEVVGACKTIKQAIMMMIKAAHYSEGEGGTLRQYLRESDDYESFQHLIDTCVENMTLIDEDIYRIEPITIQ
jgi:hypothetical protein|uniref:Uncharacterized protein n=1 Tax=viral metagenome TaxID=1070528 RepID=A0A6C0LW54_9ZZZZ